jgi:hypothetical protein
MVGSTRLWYKMRTNEILDFFVTNESRGLASSEVTQRASKFGYNPALVFGKESAAFFKYKVLRDGRNKDVASDKLVYGDIIILKKGDIVPCDLRILKVNKFSVNEEKLTGNYAPTIKNSLNINKLSPKPSQKNMLFAGTAVLNGAAQAIVVSYKVPKVMQHKKVKTSKILRQNNIVNNTVSRPSNIKGVDLVVFDDLNQEYEVIKAAQLIFMQKNIPIVCFLQSSVTNKVRTSLPEASVIKSLSHKITKEVVILNSLTSGQKLKAVANFNRQGFKVLYVYRGEKYQPAAGLASINLIINKKSQQLALYNASLIAGRLQLSGLSSILHNKI